MSGETASTCYTIGPLATRSVDLGSEVNLSSWSFKHVTTRVSESLCQGRSSTCCRGPNELDFGVTGLDNTVFGFKRISSPCPEDLTSPWTGIENVTVQTLSGALSSGLALTPFALLQSSPFSLSPATSRSTFRALGVGVKPNREGLRSSGLHRSPKPMVHPWDQRTSPHLEVAVSHLELVHLPQHRLAAARKRRAPNVISGVGLASSAAKCLNKIPAAQSEHH